MTPYQLTTWHREQANSAKRKTKVLSRQLRARPNDHARRRDLEAARKEHEFHTSAAQCTAGLDHPDHVERLASANVRVREEMLTELRKLGAEFVRVAEGLERVTK